MLATQICRGAVDTKNTWRHWVWHKISPWSPSSRSAAIIGMSWRHKQWDTALPFAATPYASADYEPYHFYCHCRGVIINIPHIEGIVRNLHLHHTISFCADQQHFHVTILAILHLIAFTSLAADSLYRRFIILLCHHHFTLLSCHWCPNNPSSFFNRRVSAPIFSQCQCRLNCCLTWRSLASWQSNDIGIPSSLRLPLGIRAVLAYWRPGRPWHEAVGLLPWQQMLAPSTTAHPNDRVFWSGCSSPKCWAPLSCQRAPCILAPVFDPPNRPIRL